MRHQQPNLNVVPTRNRRGDCGEESLDNEGWEDPKEALGALPTGCWKQIVAFFDDSRRCCPLRSKFNGRLQCFSWRLNCGNIKFFSRRNQSWESSFWGGGMSTWEIRLLRGQVQSLTQSQGSAAAPESPHAHWRYAKWFLKIQTWGVKAMAIHVSFKTWSLQGTQRALLTRCHLSHLKGLWVKRAERRKESLSCTWPSRHHWCCLFYKAVLGDPVYCNFFFFFLTSLYLNTFPVQRLFPPTSSPPLMTKHKPRACLW